MSDNCFFGFPGWLQATTVPFPEVGEKLAPLLKMPLSSLLCEQVDTSTLVFLHARDGVKMSRYFCCLSESPFELSVISLHPTCVLIFCFGKLNLWFWPFTFNEDFKSKSCCICKKNTLKGKFAGKHVLPHRWHFFNSGDVLTKKPVTTQDDEDCYKSLVSKNTKSSPLLSRDLRPGQSCSRYRVWPRTKNHLLLPFCGSIFQRRGDRDRRIWNGRDPPCCIRRPV